MRYRLHLVITVLFFLGLATAAVTAAVGAGQAAVSAEDISGRAYFDAVARAIDSAKTSVDIALNCFYVRKDDEENPVYKLLQRLISIDELFTTWRYRHA